VTFHHIRDRVTTPATTFETKAANSQSEIRGFPQCREAFDSPTAKKTMRAMHATRMVGDLVHNGFLTGYKMEHRQQNGVTERRSSEQTGKKCNCSLKNAAGGPRSALRALRMLCSWVLVHTCNRCRNCCLQRKQTTCSLNKLFNDSYRVNHIYLNLFTQPVTC